MFITADTVCCGVFHHACLNKYFSGSAFKLPLICIVICALSGVFCFIQCTATAHLAHCSVLLKKCWLYWTCNPPTPQCLYFIHRCRKIIHTNQVALWVISYSSIGSLLSFNILEPYTESGRALHQSSLLPASSYSKHPKSVFVPLLLVWERQYNTVFVFSSRLLWRGCNVLLLIGRLKFSEVLLLSESAVDLFSTRFHFHRLCFLFCQLTQQAHLSVFWGLSVGGWVIKRPTPNTPILSSPLPSIAWFAHDFKSLYSPKSLTRRKSFQRATAESIIRPQPSLSLPALSLHRS